MVKQDGQMKTRLNVTQHEERDEDHPTNDGHRKNYAIFGRLEHK